MGTIANGKNKPINVQTGFLPDVSGALKDWFQPMVFIRLVKAVVGYQETEVEEPINFRGVIQNYQPRQLLLLPEGQRAWTWIWLHAEPSLELQNDEIVSYLGVKTRVMSKKDYVIYGYVEYSLVQDWEQV